MIIDCKRIADSIELKPQHRVLGIIRWGENKDAEMYCKSIMREVEKYNISVVEIDISGREPYCIENIVGALVRGCNKIVCLNPFPPEIKERLKDLIPPKMDIDNFTGRSKYKNCTAEAVRMVLEEHYKSIEGLDAVVLGANVGWEIAKELKDMGATVTVCNSKTRCIESIICNSDLVISAVGKKDLINHAIVSYGHIIIDVGNDTTKYLQKYAQNHSRIHLTPQRNGIGLITTKILLKKVLED